MSRFPQDLVQHALELLSSDEVRWLEAVDYKQDTENPALTCDFTALSCGNPAPSCLEQNRTEQKEQNTQKAEKIVCASSNPNPDPEYYPEAVATPRQLEGARNARIIIAKINKLSGAQFREVGPAFNAICEVFNDPHVTLSEVILMIERQWECWQGTELQKHFTPKTLFSPEKFEAYFGQRNLPAVRNGEKPEGKSLMVKEFERIAKDIRRV